MTGSDPNPTLSPAPEQAFRLDWGLHGILGMLGRHDFHSVLDIGSGQGEHKRFFELFGKEVHSLDLIQTADYVGDFLEVDFDRQFDAVWCSHVLEHQRNVGLFLDKVFHVLRDDGVLAIIVPLHPRERLISGHLTSWSIPLLCYNLVMAGFDCQAAEILGTYELSLIVRKVRAEHSEIRSVSAHGADAGVTFENTSRFFPFPARQGTTVSSQGAINWPQPIHYRLPRPARSRDIRLRIESKNIVRHPQLSPRINFVAE